MQERLLTRYDPAVAALAVKYRCEDTHHRRVESFALELWELLRPFHRLGGGEAALLRHAARVHDLGHHVAERRHQRRGQYLIRHDELLAGYPEPARSALGLLVRNHRKSPRVIPASWGTDLARRVLQLCAWLRLADGLDGSRDPAVRLVGFQAGGRAARLFVYGLERVPADWMQRKACLVQPAFGCVLQVVGTGAGVARGEIRHG